MSVDIGDIETAKQLANKLKFDKDFYQKCSDEAQKKYKDCFSKNIYIYDMKRVMTYD